MSLWSLNFIILKLNPRNFEIIESLLYQRLKMIDYSQSFLLESYSLELVNLCNQIFHWTSTYIFLDNKNIENREENIFYFIFEVLYQFVKLLLLINFTAFIKNLCNFEIKYNYITLCWMRNPFNLSDMAFSILIQSFKGWYILVTFMQTYHLTRLVRWIINRKKNSR